MEETILGRHREMAMLKQIYESDRSEFVAVYGRRRVGKTYLIKQYFKNRMDFYVTGICDGTPEEQYANFNRQLCEYSKSYFPVVDNWFDAFEQLKKYLAGLRKKRIVIFIDELPWFDTQKSRFTKALELFWNSWASDRDNIVFIVCGSATTWMVSKLIGSRGGLHNRITHKIKLQPFTLSETAEFLKKRGFVFSSSQIAECYMVLGGIPYYLNLLQKNLSLAQNIDNLFFSSNAELRDEYSFLFRSLFDDSQAYKRVVELLATKRKGMTRKEIKDALKLSDGGSLTRVLNDLCRCDFVSKYYSFEKKERDALYQLCDMYSLFYLHFVANFDGFDENFWSNMVDSSAHYAWCGYAFEQVCLMHVPQIKNALGISGIQTNVCSWVCRDEGEGAQIDLVIDRRDDTINLCEIKFSLSKYEITADYAEWLEERREIFRKKTQTRKSLYLTMITNKGLKQNAYSGTVQNDIVVDDLIKK
jgi:hypothetical protein